MKTTTPLILLAAVIFVGATSCGDESRKDEEIAALSGVGVSALKMRVKRACDYLRGRLQEVARD